MSRTAPTTAQSTTVEYGDEDDLQLYFQQRDLTDGLPVVIPTEKRVDAFVRASGFDPGLVVGPIDPQRGVATVHNVAVNALMAGCRPDQLGVVLGAIEALMKDPFKLRGVQATTNPVAPLCIVNGPIRNRIGVASGRNALSPGQTANGPIGRAIRFVMRNIGGGLGDVDRATLGFPGKYTFCLGENEEASPWPGHHTSLGYAPDEDVVTMIGIESFIDVIPVFKTADPIIDHFARAMRNGGTNVYWSRGTLLMVVSPGHADILAGEGFTREKLQERLFEEAMIPLSDMPYGNIPQGHWVERDGKVLITESPQDIYIVCAGGPEPLHSVYMTGFGVANAASAKVWHPGERQ
jgi:hypothetical protein